MKKLIVLLAVLFIGISSFCQTKKPKEVPKSVSTTAGKVVPANQSTVIFVLTNEQVKLLEYVLGESQAGHKDVMTMINILQNQQYHQPVDTTSVKKDSTAVHK